MNEPKTLSDVPSEFLQQALEDYDVVSKDPSYRVNMSSWHRPSYDGVCEVCLAGCVMAKSFSASPQSNLMPSDLTCGDFQTHKKLMALDSLRTGDLNGAMVDLGFNKKRDSVENIPIETFHVNPFQWRSDMNRVVAALKEAGL